MSLEHPILGIDHGEARVGLAITDAAGIIAYPVATVVNDESLFTSIVSEFNARQAKSIIIGIPLLADGSEGKAALKIRKFKNELVKQIGSHVPVEFVDEAGTTIAASAKLRSAGKKSHTQKDMIDQAAAVEILNHYMNSQDNPYGLLEDPDAMF